MEKYKQIHIGLLLNIKNPMERSKLTELKLVLQKCRMALINFYLTQRI